MSLFSLGPPLPSPALPPGAPPQGSTHSREGTRSLLRTGKLGTGVLSSSQDFTSGEALQPPGPHSRL